MKHLGIDYGTKNIGLALSDDSGSMAFPHSIIPSNDASVAQILALIEKEKIESIVVGHSLSGSGAENAVMDRVHSFIKGISAKTTVPVHLYNEFGSSVAVRAFQDFADATPRRQATKHRSGDETAKRDDSAAALILQRYLEAQKRNS